MQYVCPVTSFGRLPDIATRKESDMAARKPEEVDRLFKRAMNAADIDALLALYEPQASLGVEAGAG